MWSLAKQGIGDYVKTVRGENKRDKRLEKRLTEQKGQAGEEKLVEQEGYFTVEAAFLVPIISFLGIGIMMISLYICDMNQAKSYIQCTVSALSSDKTESSSVKTAQARAWMEENLFVSSVEECSLTQNGKKVKGEITIRMNLNIPLVGSWLGRQWKSTFFFSVNRERNTEQMRRWDQIE